MNKVSNDSPRYLGRAVVSKPHSTVLKPPPFIMTKKYNEILSLTNNFKKLTLIPSIIIGKELASELLLLNTSNRPIHEFKLKQYKEDLSKGEWKFAADVIKISKLGVLLDGQHRLLAIQQTGIPMQVHIQSGLEPEVFIVLDTGDCKSSISNINTSSR